MKIETYTFRTLAVVAIFASGWILLPLRAAVADDPHFLVREISNTARFVRSVAAADVDGDGDLDILAALPVDKQVVWFENGGTPNDKFTTQHVIDADLEGAFWIYAPDMDGDGDVDPIVAVDHGTHSEIVWYENLGGTPPMFHKHVITTNVLGVDGFYPADLDTDGDVDLVSASRTNDMIAWYENDGGSPPSFAQHIITMDPDGTLGPLQGFADGVWFVSAGDVDGDGDGDILFAAVAQRMLGWYENDGNRPPTFTPHVVTMGVTPINGPASVAAVDLDGDGDMDLAVSSVSDDRISWFENDGGRPPAFTFHNISQGVETPWRIAAADMDADGDLDLVSASDRLRWYENDGGSPPSFTMHVVATAARFAEGVIAADLNGDGRPDIVTADPFIWMITLYTNRLVLPPGLRR